MFEIFMFTGEQFSNELPLYGVTTREEWGGNEPLQEKDECAQCACFLI